MSAAKKSTTKQHSWQLTGAWAGAWKIFAVIGAIGLAASLFGYTQDARRFAFSWMFAFVTVLTVALGMLFFVLVQRLTSAGWSVTVRRTAEFFATGLLVLSPLFVPVLLTMGHLFPWLGHHEAPGAEHGADSGHVKLMLPSLENEAHAQQSDTQHTSGNTHIAPSDPQVDTKTGTEAHHGNRKEGGMVPSDEQAHAGSPGEHRGGEDKVHPAGGRDPHAVIHEEVMQKKAAYLNKNFFLIRAGFYFIVWIFVALRLFGYSTAQDTSKDPSLTIRAQRGSFPALVLFVITITFAGFDWIMSLEPSWFSTIFGVYVFACAVISSYAVLILTTLAFRNAGPLDGAVTVEHYHDLGKLQFGFLVFWAYIGFSQFMLIWYAALPEETTWYHNRWDHEPWAKVSLAILAGHFVVPFFWTISRNFKRNTGRLQIGSAILIVMHVIDMYWFVMPNYLLGKDGFTFHWLDVTCLLACAGIYGAYVFYRMTKFPLVPVGDPRLERSLHFQNA